VEILISHPRFYWGEVGNVNTRPDMAAAERHRCLTRPDHRDSSDGAAFVQSRVDPHREAAFHLERIGRSTNRRGSLESVI
jgi:hypothetical protein